MRVRSKMKKEKELTEIWGIIGLGFPFRAWLALAWRLWTTELNANHTRLRKGHRIHDTGNQQEPPAYSIWGRCCLEMQFLIVGLRRTCCHTKQVGGLGAEALGLKIDHWRYWGKNEGDLGGKSCSHTWPVYKVDQTLWQSNQASSTEPQRQSECTPLPLSSSQESPRTYSACRYEAMYFAMAVLGRSRQSKQIQVERERS